MSQLTYSVWRQGNDVFYKIKRGKVHVVTNEVKWTDLSLIDQLFRYTPCTEKSIEGQLKHATKLAKMAIRSMINHEVTENPI